MEPFSAEDFTAALIAEMPTGAVWPRDLDAVMPQVMAALAPTFARLAARDLNLLADAFPVAPLELLPEWESTLGLPDPCAGPSPTIEQRQKQVNGRFIGDGGQSAGYLVGIAAALGFDITITQYKPFRLGHSKLGAPLMGPGWQYVWDIHAPTITVSRFTLGRSFLGDPFWTISNAELECTIRALAPAHTLARFIYGS